MADIDIESERFRFMGEPRFTVYAVWRILSKQIHVQHFDSWHLFIFSPFLMATTYFS